MTIVAPARGTAALAAGIALIALPVVAFGVKLFSFGWLMFVLIAVGLFLFAGYVLQVVIAATAFIPANGAARVTSGGGRAIVAAWLTSVAVVLAAFFLVDGGDTAESVGSTFMFAFGLGGSTAAGEVSTVLFLVFAAVWLLAWVWLVVEWIVALVAKRSAARAAA